MLSGDPISGEKFGFPVIIKEEVILVTAIETSKWINSENIVKIGSVYTFEREENTDQRVKSQKLMPSDAAGWDKFGKRADISSSTIVVGAKDYDVSGNRNAYGAAYFFEKNEMTRGKKSIRLKYRIKAVDLFLENQ